MKKFKVNSKGEVEGNLVVNYLMNYVFDILEGTYSGEFEKFKIKLNWFDIWSGGIKIEKMMREVSENKLWEGFEIKLINGEVMKFEGIIGKNDEWIVDINFNN